MKLGDSIGNNAKFERLRQNCSHFDYSLQKLDFQKITPLHIFSSNMKLGS